MQHLIVANKILGRLEVGLILLDRHVLIDVEKGKKVIDSDGITIVNCRLLGCRAFAKLGQATGGGGINTASFTTVSRSSYQTTTLDKLFHRSSTLIDTINARRSEHPSPALRTGNETLILLRGSQGDIHGIEIRILLKFGPRESSRDFLPRDLGDIFDMNGPFSPS